jgi:hypothetical protein
MKMTFTVAAVVLAAAAIGCNRDTATANRTASGGNGLPRATLTGCFVSGDQPGTYVLRLASAADTTTTGTASSTPSAANDASAGRAFRVVPDKQEDLSSHLNTRVAINGYVESSSASANGSAAAQGQTASNAAGSTGSTPGSNSGATAGTSGSSMQVLRAESIRKVGDRCIEDAAQR